jgi:hypothetical protein
MFEPQLRPLRSRQKNSAWASRQKKLGVGLQPAAGVWLYALGDGAHCPCAARQAAERSTTTISKAPKIFCFHKNIGEDTQSGRQSITHFLV